MRISTSIFLIASLIYISIINKKAEAVVYGCGPSSFTEFADFVLNLTGESVLIDCCVKHDKCYGMCVRNNTQSKCDDDFEQCLNSACKQIDESHSDLCNVDSSAMVKLVREFGKNFFCKPKKRDAN